MRALKKDNPKKTNEEFIPKIAVVKSNDDIQAAANEFNQLLGIKCLGMRICSLEEAIDQKLPLRQAQLQFLQKIPHDIVICKGVDELIPEDYKDPETPVDLRLVKFKSDVVEAEVNIGILKQKRNEKCACGSGKKYKNCCMKEVN